MKLQQQINLCKGHRNGRHGGAMDVVTSSIDTQYYYYYY